MENFHGTENETWDGFWPVGNIEKTNWGADLLKNIVASAQKSIKRM